MQFRNNGGRGYSPSKSMSNDDLEVDINELIWQLWKQKFVIIGITFIFSVASVLFSLSKPNLFKSEAVLFPISNENTPSNVMNQLGGIAALAGFGTNDSVKQQVAIETLRSKLFLTEFIKNRDILIPLMALKEWDYRTGEISLDATIYNSESNKWVRDVREGKDPKPTLLEAYKELNEYIDVSKNKNSGAIVLSVVTQSPFLSQQWLAWLIEDLNVWMKNKEIKNLKDNIKYLNEQLNTTQLADTQSVFYRLIEEQIKKLMLSEAQDQYVFDVIDPPMVPEEKDSPSRGIICIIGAFLGGVFSMIIAIVRIVLSKKRNEN